MECYSRFYTSGVNGYRDQLMKGVNNDQVLASYTCIAQKFDEEAM